MEKMNISEIMQYVSEHPDINYIAHVATPMTVIWAKTCLYYMYEKMKISNLKGIFIINAWTEGKLAINNELPVTSSASPWLEKPMWVINENGDSGARKNNRIVRKTKSPRVIYMIDTDVLWIRPSFLSKKYYNIDLRHIYIEFDKKPFSIRETIINNWFLIRENGLFPIARIYAHRFAANTGAFICGFDVKRIHGYDRKKFFSDLYIEYVKKVLENEGHEYNFYPTENYVIYLSDPYNEDDVSVVTQIAEETLVKFYEKGYKIYVKQHPRETGEVPFKHICVEYLPREYAIEALIATSAIKPKAIIAGSTSAIIEIARIWENIDCYYILNDDRIRGHISLEWFRNYTNCAISKIPNLMDATQCKVLQF